MVALETLTEDMSSFGDTRQAAMTLVQTVATQIKDEATAVFNSLTGETWANGLRREMDGKTSGAAAPQDKFAQTGNCVNKKEVAVWKLLEDLDRSGFRHWVKAAGFQLEVIHTVHVP